MNDCIFCKIINKEIPCYKVYEDDNVLAFLDIAPVTSGHILVIPKKHVANFEEADENVLKNLIIVVKKIGKLIKEKLNTKGYSVSVNNDPIAGQVVPHLHFHIIPRYKENELELWPQGKYNEGEAEELLKKLKV